MPGPRQPLISWRHHLTDRNWLTTSTGAPRGYIQPGRLRELWFHTGTICNLGCPFCLEGAGPKERRVKPLRFDDARRFIDEAVALGVDQFSFTGGEPFCNRDFFSTLDYAARYKTCLVLTNGTGPLRQALPALANLSRGVHPIKFRISLDYPDPTRHDRRRGAGTFELARLSLRELHAMGFEVSIARHRDIGEDETAVRAAYRSLLAESGLPLDTHLVAFPQLHPPGDHPVTPEITENCMTTHKTAADRERFMCAYSKMVVTGQAGAGVYACTLVDDDPDYRLGDSLKCTRGVRVMLRHHRCFACFSEGASCSD